MRQVEGCPGYCADTLLSSSSSVLRSLEGVETRGLPQRSTCYVLETEQLYRWHAESLASGFPTVVRPAAVEPTAPGRWLLDDGGGAGAGVVDIRDYGADTNNSSNTAEIAAAIADAEEGGTVIVPPGEWRCEIGEPGVDPNLVEYATSEDWWTPFLLDKKGLIFRLLPNAHLRFVGSYINHVVGAGDEIHLFALSKNAPTNDERRVDGVRLEGSGYSSTISFETSGAATITDQRNDVFLLKGTGNGDYIGQFRVEGVPNGGWVIGVPHEDARTVLEQIWVTDWPGGERDFWWRLDGNSLYRDGCLIATGPLPGQGFYSALDRPFHIVQRIHFKDLNNDRPIDFRGGSGTSHRECTVEGCWFEDCAWSAFGDTTGASYDRMMWINNRCTGSGGLDATNVRGLVVSGFFEGGAFLKLTGCREVSLDVTVYNGTFLTSYDETNDKQCRNLSGTLRMFGAPAAPISQSVARIQSAVNCDLTFLCEGLSDDDQLFWLSIHGGVNSEVRDTILRGSLSVDHGDAAPTAMVQLGPVLSCKIEGMILRHPGGNDTKGLLIGQASNTAAQRVMVHDCDFHMGGAAIDMSGNALGRVWIWDNRQHALPSAAAVLDFGGGASIYAWNNHWTRSASNTAGLVALSRDSDGNAFETS